MITDYLPDSKAFPPGIEYLRNCGMEVFPVYSELGTPTIRFVVVLLKRGRGPVQFPDMIHTATEEVQDIGNGWKTLAMIFSLNDELSEVRTKIITKACSL